MKKSTSAAAIGVFVLGASALAIVAVIILWGGRLFTHSHQYVLYFTGDVSGLQPGAPVKFKGVQVGYVDRIFLRMSGFYGKMAPTLTIPVIVSLNSNTVVHVDTGVVRPYTGFLDLDNPVVVQKLIADGLRGQIGSESLVTGILYVSLDLRPNSTPHFMAPKDSKYVEIPTVPTAFQQVQDVAMRTLAKLSALDIDKLMAEFSDTVAQLSEIAGSPQLKASIATLPAALNHLSGAAASIQHLADHANTELSATTEALRKTSLSATTALQATQKTLTSITSTLGPGSSLDYQLGQTLQDLDQAARSTRELADYLNRNPSALIRGRGTAAP